MPFKDPEKAKEYRKQYFQKNKEKIKIYREQNKNEEKEKEYQKQYREKNKEKAKEYHKEYFKKYSNTYEGIKNQRISRWKFSGIITDDYEELYNHYLKTAYCDFCRVELTYDKKRTATTKCVDHDHSITDSPNFRNILCHSCNIKRR